jgi:hypothetical protein
VKNALEIGINGVEKHLISKIGLWNELACTSTP